MRVLQVPESGLMEVENYFCRLDLVDQGDQKLVSAHME
jgi:hypothetical protein